VATIRDGGGAVWVSGVKDLTEADCVAGLMGLHEKMVKKIIGEQNILWHY